MEKRSNKKVILFVDKENCCGCTACYAICPERAISMRADNEGFLYPAIDESKCMKCQKCLSVCAFKNEQEKKRFLR